MGPGKGAGGRPQGEASTRRSVLRGMGAGALATGAGGVLAACSSGSKISPAASSTSTINIGYIAPFTGSLAGFASADKFVVNTIRNTPAFAKGFKAGARPIRSTSSSTTASPIPTGRRSSPVSSSSTTTWTCC